MSNWKYFDPRKMTLQEIVDASVQHVIDQGKPAYDQTRNMCQYRTKDGLQCAASIFISDEEYVEEFEAMGFPAVAENFSKIQENKVELIAELQDAHDNVSEWFIGDNEEIFLKEYKDCVLTYFSDYNLPEGVRN